MTIAFRADRLRTLREQSGMSQRELARRCGLGDTQIHKYERGEADPTSSSVKQIADVLDTTADYLLGRSDDPREMVVNNELSAEERDLVQTFRSGGWLGMLRLVADRMEK